MARCYDGDMRTTITLDDGLHRRLAAAAADMHTTMNQLVNDLLEQAMGTTAGGVRYVGRDEATGFPLFDTAGTITIEDVRSLEDDE